VSEGTLKWQLHNVYSKLEVKNRPGAMAKARALGIL
jgi:LuxR family transcriptional regulator, maltose regulon positive regulatory protein